ncbi:hypothetical protein [Vibrio cholerae]|uniref:hypothetical protein n=1 Tax=Vibrio cholerae TaxID=666 RepID=UPI000E6A6E9F|nr:hypothetical protein [Vibrio cholerae]
MGIGIELYRMLQSHKQVQNRKDYDLWLANHKEQLLRERQENNRKVAEQIEAFNSNLKVRVKRLECLGELSGVANGMYACQRIENDSIIYLNYLRKAVSLGVECHQPFRHLLSVRSSYAIKTELVLAFYFFLHSRVNAKFQSLNVLLDLGSINVMAGWILNHMSYFVAAGMRATNTHLSLFDCLNEQQKAQLLAKNDREGLLLNRFCGNPHNKTVAYLCRMISSQVTTCGLHANYVSEESPLIRQLQVGHQVGVHVLCREHIQNDEKRLSNALSYFDNFSSISDIEPVFDSQPIWASVYCMLAIIEKESPEYLAWLSDLFADVSNHKQELSTKWSVENLFAINKIFGFFQDHSMMSELFVCITEAGMNGGYPFILLPQPTEVDTYKDPVHLKEADFPVLSQFISEAFRSSNFGGALGQVFQLENR